MLPITVTCLGWYYISTSITNFQKRYPALCTPQYFLVLSRCDILVPHRHCFLPQDLFRYLIVLPALNMWSSRGRCETGACTDLIVSIKPCNQSHVPILELNIHLFGQGDSIIVLEAPCLFCSLLSHIRVLLTFQYMFTSLYECVCLCV